MADNLFSTEQIIELATVAGLEGTAHNQALRLAAMIQGAYNSELAAKQAVIDRLMLEYCPSEMTQEQLAAWQQNQQPDDHPEDYYGA